MKEPLSTDTTLVTPRSRMVYPTDADYEHIWSASRVAGFNDGMLWDPPATWEEMEAPLLASQAQWRSGQAYGFSMMLTEDEIFIGRFGIRREEPMPDNCWSIGYWVHPRHQGQGYAHEGARALVQFGFEELNAERVIASCATWNTASARVLVGTGMTQVGTTEQGFMKRGEWVAEYDFALERADYLRQG